MLLSTLQFFLFHRIFPHSVSSSALEVRDEVTSNTWYDQFLNNGSSKQRIAFHSIALLKDHIYIEGGQIATFIDGNPTHPDLAVETNTTFSFPVNKAWTAETVELNTISHPSGMRSMNFVGLWADEAKNALYQWGGLLVSDAIFEKGHKNQFFAMEPDNNGGGKWTQKTPANSDTFLGLMASERAASTFCGDAGFYIGSHASGHTGDYGLDGNTTPTRGVRMYNATNMMWYNDTETNTNDFNDDIDVGDAVCLPGLREQPLVMVLGGKRSSGNYIDMANVRIYDPVSQNWSLQQTISYNGAYPEGREAACLVSVQGKNNTLEIFMSGGMKGESVYSDMWVLSLPAFKWFSIPVEMQARQMHRCVVAGNRQMISVGGVSTVGMNSFKAADEWSRGIGVFDLVDLKWKSSFDPNLDEYDSPEVVREWYTSGNSDNVIYAEGLKSIFQNRTTNNGGNAGDQESKTSTNIAGIAAGASIGGVAAIALAAGAFWFLRRRRQQRSGGDSEQQQEAAYLPEETKKWDPSASSTCGTELDSTVMTEMECQQTNVDFMKASPHLAELHEGAAFAEMDATPRLK